MTLTINAEYFSCSTCRLALDGYEYLEQAELPISFEIEGDPSDAYGEQEYGND